MKKSLEPRNQRLDTMTDDEKKQTVSKDNIFVGFMGPLSFPKMNTFPGQKPEEITNEDILN